jgi:hypothetical protein
MMSALDTTAVDAIAILPAVVVANSPSGIIVSWQLMPDVVQPGGGVIVATEVVPVT